MPVSPTYPGVYVQEIPSGVRTIAGVSTSVALFVGYTSSGPLDTPTQLFSFTDYVRYFSDDTTASDMARQVKMFFLNGGTQCYVLRIASGADNANVILKNEDATSVLTLEAANAGAQGGSIRAAVTYDGSQPEDTFNLTLFRWETQSNGTVTAKDTETFTGLSMNPTSPAYVLDYLASNSKLVTASLVGTLTPVSGFSQSGKYLAGDDTPFSDFKTSWNAVVVTGTSDKISMSVDGGRYITVTLPQVDAEASLAAFATTVQTAITAAYTAALVLPLPVVAVSFDPATIGGDPYQALRITSSLVTGSLNNGTVAIRSASSNDVSAALKLGTGSGGLEVGPYAKYRPAPTGVSFGPAGGVTTDLTALMGATAVTVTLNEYNNTTGVAAPRSLGAVSMSAGTTVIGRLELIRNAVNNAAAAPTTGTTFPWSAEIWGGNRLTILATNGPIADGSDDGRVSGIGWSGAGASAPTNNIRYYSLGSGGTGTYQTPGAQGSDGTAPTASEDYDAAYEIVRQKVDLFNLLILPSVPTNVALLESLWPNASVFAEERRALLLMEAPADWSGTQTPLNEIATLRTGTSKQYAALYHPRLTIKENGVKYNISPVGAIAGLMARTDAGRGVWKAPAGTEADIRGVVGLAETLSDRQNGVLNPKGINIIRSFPEGVVCWGARTLDGDDGFGSEYKYVPVRRLANYMEETLYRGLRWAVFMPNDEPLWAQIRLNVGAFVHNLFRQGAFQGKTPSEAYFVKCDAETTTQNDRDLGIVNVWVGFAPLKPAEFVILSLQQMAGQVSV